MADRGPLLKYKGNCCASCGLSVEEMVKRYGTFNRQFEFNHIDPSQKDPNYDNLIRQTISTAQLDELDKCVLLCRQCHGIVHAQNVNGEMFVQVSVEGKTAEQRLTGQFILDHADKKATFLTSDKVLVLPYRLQIGDAEPELVFGTDLENGRLHDLIQSLAQHRSFIIRSWSNEELLRAELLAPDRCKLDIDMRFPLAAAELWASDDGSVDLWHRNGKCIAADGTVMEYGRLTIELDPRTAEPELR